MTLSTDNPPTRVHRAEYNAWVHMRIRCTKDYHPQWKDYGGRGISVHPDWLTDFWSFLAHVGPRPTTLHTLDRIDNDGNYEPGNVRWAARQEQQNNRRGNNWITHPATGETHTMSQWAQIRGLTPAVIYNRLKVGWTVEATLDSKVQQRMGRAKYRLNGELISISKYAKTNGMNVNTLYSRLHKGWSVEETLGITPRTNDK